ncbi:MAG: chemotaxis response regulator protein-glutamate methylesterase [FCB group bacterium]|nr:chemotaxis response regulator protein-glutamate methylesterase [FCB group bacterium]
MPGKIKVLIVDDSALVRNILSSGLGKFPDLEIAGTAANPYIARDMIVKTRPHVLTLDVEMPRMDGVEFLRKLMPQYPLPVVMVSALTEKGKKITLQALEAGAIDFVTKPSTDIARGLTAMITDLHSKIITASRANVSGWKRERKEIREVSTERYTALAESTDKVIAIGASTGGTEAIRNVITRFSAVMPGVVIVQHMPAGFTKMFADRLNEQCQMNVKEAEDGDRVMAGRILIAPGDYQMRVVRSGGIYKVRISQEEKVCGHSPSVEVLFQSVAKYAGGNGLGIILTGMGHDGANGMLALKQNGARTIAQDEASSVVYGMPKVAYERGGVEFVVSIENIANKVVSLLTENN